MTDQPAPSRAATPKKALSAPARPGAAIRQRDLFQLDSPLTGAICGERSLMAFPFSRSPRARG